MSKRKTLKLWATRDRDGDIQIFPCEPVPDGGGEFGAAWTNPENKYDYVFAASRGNCGVARALSDLFEPLSFKAGQLVEFEVREVQRWEKNE